jgi:hypothetical protein
MPAMKNMLNELWEREELPCIDAIFFPNGKVFRVHINVPQLTINIKDEFNLNEFILQDTEYVSSIGLTCEILMTDGFKCYAGEGSFGSDGFIACLNNKSDIAWIFFSEWSNPFEELEEISPRKIRATSTANFFLLIDIENPLNMEIYPA